MQFRETVTLPDGTVVVREVEWENEKLIWESSCTRSWLESRLLDFFGKATREETP